MTSTSAAPAGRQQNDDDLSQPNQRRVGQKRLTWRGNMTTYITSYLRAKIHPTFTYEEATWIYTGNLMAQGVIMTLGGYLDWRFGPRVTSLLGCSLATIGVAATFFSINVSPWLVVFTYGVLFGFGVGIGYVVPVACGMRWSPDNRKGLVTGIIIGGFGLGSFIFTPVQTVILNPKNVSVDETGYFTDEEILQRVPYVFLSLATTYAVLQLIGCCLIRNPPPPRPVDDEDKKQEITAGDSRRSLGEALPIPAEEHPSSPEPKDGRDSGNSNPMMASSSSSKESSSRDANEIEIIKDEEVNILADDQTTAPRRADGDSSLSPRQILKTREFYMLWLTFTFNQQAIGYISTMYKAYGLTFITNDKFLAVVGSLASVFNCLGRFVWGAVGDRTCYRTAMMMVTAMLTVLFVAFSFSQLGGQIIYAALVIAIFSTFCGNFALLPRATYETFGPTFAGTNYGLVFTSSIFSQPLQSVLVKNLTGLIGTTGVLYVTAGFTAMSFILTSFYDKHPGPEKLRTRLGLPPFRD